MLIEIANLSFTDTEQTGSSAYVSARDVRHIGVDGRYVYVTCHGATTALVLTCKDHESACDLRDRVAYEVNQALHPIRSLINYYCLPGLSFVVFLILCRIFMRLLP